MPHGSPQIAIRGFRRRLFKRGRSVDNLRKRGQKKSGLFFQSPEEHLREAGMCIQERVAYCRVGQTPRGGAAKALELEERKTVRENHAIQRNRTEKRIRPSALYWSKIIKAGALIGDTKKLLSWS